MPRSGISYHDVKSAAETLVAENHKPTLNNIRAQIGSGSLSTIYRHLNAWRETQSSERSRPQLSDDLIRTLNGEIERAAKTACAEADKRAKAARAEADKLASERESLKSERDNALQAQSEAESKRDRAVAERDAKQQEIDRLRADMKRHKEWVESNRQNLAQLQNKVEILQEQRDQEQTARREAEQRALTAEKETAKLSERVESRNEIIEALRVDQNEPDLDPKRQA